jgi:chromosome segregation ATPase
MQCWLSRRKEADLEKHLNTTKEQLAKDEKQLAEDKETFNRVYESKDAEIAELKKRLASTELKLAAAIKEHKPCAGIIAGLRKTITELQLSRDKLKAAIDSKDAQLDEVKKMLGDQLMDVLMKLLVEHRDMKVQLASITKKHDDCECRTAEMQKELEELKKEPESNMRFI